MNLTIANTTGRITLLHLVLRVGLFCLFLIAWPSQAASPALRDIATLEDPTAAASIEQVAAYAPEQFRPTGDSLSASRPVGAQWLRFTVPAAAGELWLVIGPSFLDDLRLYERDADHPGAFIERRAGDLLPLSAREVQTPNFVFRLQPAKGTDRIYYLRVQTTSPLLVTLQLFTPEDFAAASSQTLLSMGLFYGALGALIVANLLFWLWGREPLCGPFLLYLAGTLGLSIGIDGLVALLLAPDLPEVGDHWVRLAMILKMATGAPLYARLILVDRRQSFFYGLYMICLWLPVLLCLCHLMGWNQLTDLVLAALWLLAHGAGLLRCEILRRQRHPGSLLGLLAFGLTSLGVLVGVLALLDNSTPPVMAGQAFKVNALLITLLLQMALVLRARARHAELQLTLARAEQTELRAKQEALARREQTQFMAMLTHELNTPLAVIDGAAQSLRHLVQHADATRRIERIQRSVQRIAVLVRQFLRHDELSDPVIQIRAEPVDLSQLCTTVARDTIEPERLVCDLPPGVTVQADAGLLRVALSNLLDNAFKYSPPGSPVGLTLQFEGGRAGLVVDDLGPGVSSELVPHLFDRYVRGQHAGDIPGAGLGLYLVQRVAQLHRGEVLYQPHPGGGSRFVLRLPSGVTLCTAGAVR